MKLSYLTPDDLTYIITLRMLSIHIVVGTRISAMLGKHMHDFRMPILRRKGEWSGSIVTPGIDICYAQEACEQIPHVPVVRYPPMELTPDAVGSPRHCSWPSDPCRAQ